jgi:hypothetical protein
VDFIDFDVKMVNWMFCRENWSTVRQFFELKKGVMIEEICMYSHLIQYAH